MPAICCNSPGIESAEIAAASAIKASIVAPAASSNSWAWHASRSCRNRRTSAEAASAAGSSSGLWQRASWQSTASLARRVSTVVWACCRFSSCFFRCDCKRSKILLIGHRPAQAANEFLEGLLEAIAR